MKKKTTSIEEMKKQQKYYKTNVEYCNCSQNKLISAQLAIDLPCIHRLTLEKPPEIPEST